MNRYLTVLISCLIVLFSSCATESSETPQEVDKPSDYFSGVWVTSSASSVLDSKENIVKAVSVCKEYGINNIFMVVWNNGRTYYPSKVMKELIGIEIVEKYQGRDPLKEMIEEAHANGIKVHAWFEYGFAASYGQNGGLILARKPEWGAKDVNGKLLVKNGFVWMNALLPEVQDFMLSLIKEVADNYDIDGVQGDDRLPAMPSSGGYDEYVCQLYKQEHNGMEPPADGKNEAWMTWRADKLTDFLKKLYTEIKTIDSQIIVSSAPSVYPWGKNEYLQDWPSWLEKGYIDWVIPQHYRYDIDTYQSTLVQQLSYVQPKDRKEFMPAILLQNGDYNPTEDYLKKMIEVNRRNQVTNECFWFYEGLDKFPSFFQTYRQ